MLRRTFNWTGNPAVPLPGILLIVAVVGWTAPGAALQQTAGPVSSSGELTVLIKEVQGFGRERPPSLPLPPGTDERYSGRMPVVSEEYIQDRAKRAQALLDRVQVLDPSELTTSEQLDRFILAQRLRSEIANARFRTHLVPISDAAGFHVTFAREPQTRSFDTVAHYDSYIARLQSFREYTAAQIGLMREGMAIGHTLPGPSMLDDYAQTIRAHIVEDVTKSGFYEPFLRIPQGLPDADRQRIVADGERAVRESVMPAYRMFLDFMVDEYLPAVRPTVGLWAVPGGVEYYDHLVRHYTTLDISAREVHEIGLREVTRLRGEMDALIGKIGFEGTFAEFVHFLRTDRRFYVEDPQNYIKEAAYIAKRMDGELPKLFRKLPETPYGIRPFPDTPAALRGTGANYGVGRPGERAGFYNLNLSAIESRPLYILEALTFHEGVPGHHLQIMLHWENQDISDLRRNADVTAFVEGWALYAERLGLEVGFYTDPYSDFGRLTYEIWRACRLVVDTGMHAFQWTRQQAIDYMAENTALSLHEVTTEVDRYIRSRGQALAYKMGELEITALRRLAEEKLGDRFDIREFHHAVLENGSIPLSFLRQQIDAYINRTLSVVTDQDRPPAGVNHPAETKSGR